MTKFSDLEKNFGLSSEKNVELNLTNGGEAVIAVESRYHAKNNGVSPKDHTSRGNKMKRVFLILVAIIGFGISVKAQDVITLKNGTDIQALVQEINELDIKYKKIENPSGPNYTLKKSEILIIRYANGTKDIFPEEEKPVKTKDVYKSETTSVKSNENIETVYLPENMQNRKDVIILDNLHAFQTRITRTTHKHIYFIKYKKNGKEKEVRDEKKDIALTLSFNENAKQEKYPERMPLQDFMSLPIWMDEKNHTFYVFGTNRTIGSELEKIAPDLYNSYVTGKGLANSIISVPSIIGSVKLSNALKEYYSTFVNLEVCSKYGIIVTQYNSPLNLNNTK